MKKPAPGSGLQAPVYGSGSRRWSQALAWLFVAVASTAAADPHTATLLVHISVQQGSPGGASASIEPIDHLGVARSIVAGESGTAAFSDVHAGLYRVTVGLAAHDAPIANVRLGPGEQVTLRARLVPSGDSGSARSQIQLVDRQRVFYGTVFTDRELRDLPVSGDAWSLLETAETASVVDRLDNGGLWTATPARVGLHGSSWTETRFALGDLDVTDPEQGGLPLVVPDLDPLAAVAVTSGLTPVDVAGPGATISLVPRQPGSRWRGSAEAFVLPEAFQASEAAGPPPAIARYEAWRRGTLSVAGPIVKERMGLATTMAVTDVDRMERGAPRASRATLASGLAHLVFVATPRDELRGLVAMQRARRPFDGRARFLNRDGVQHDTFFHWQAAWQRRAEAWGRWSVTAGYSRGRVEAQVGSRAPDGAIERLLDGPVTEIALPADSERHRWDLRVRGDPTLGPRFGRHALRFGLDVSRAGMTARSVGSPGTTAELLAGLPARVWEYGYGGPVSRRRGVDVAAYVADRLVLSNRVTAEAGVRYEFSQGRADGAARGISWHAIDPRVALRWTPYASGRVSVFGGVGLFRHRLLLRHLAFGDPAGPAGAYFRWHDLDGDRVFQPAEKRALVARVGPGGEVASIDSGLAPPRTLEVVLGVGRRFAGAWVVRLAGIHRHERNLLASVNVGVPPASYAVFTVTDPGGDLARATDDQVLPIYDRLPASFGLDRYVLTNARDVHGSHQALELTVERAAGDRLGVRVGATAFRSSGPAAYVGFGGVENDQGLVGDARHQPNAGTFADGRLFFDRAFMIKTAASYRGPRDVRVGLIARYQDGQPFARLVLAPDLNQGPDAVRAVANGRHRFTYILTMDARIEKGFALGERRVAAVLEAFNLLDARHEVEEDVVTGPAFRTMTAVQPPRALRVGVRVEF